MDFVGVIFILELELNKLRGFILGIFGKEGLGVFNFLGFFEVVMWLFFFLRILVKYEEFF